MASNKKFMVGTGVIAASLLLLVSPAQADQLSTSVKEVGNNIQSMPSLLNYVSYIMGTAVAVSGVSKLRAHSDNPAQNPIYPGLGRLVAAAMFVSLPHVLRMMQNTTDLDSGTQVFTEVPKITS